MRRCSRCGYEKPLSDFGRDRSTRDGVRRFCRACNAAATRRSRRARKSRLRTGRRGRRSSERFTQPKPPAAAGRTCPEPGCGTRLSVYNPSDRCSVHDARLFDDDELDAAARRRAESGARRILTP